ncbi:MAG TPA: CDP-glycerol glycerophosphotransferase family protein, partial [Bacillales bacterium]|nr:CDP-glycerol glycerophosphotransferase family protein [Bacillales bacterium]
MNRPTSIRDTRNCTLRSMAYKGRVMSLRAELCLNPSVNAVTAKDLLLVERYSRMDVSFPFRVVHTKGERNLLEADIDFLSCPELAARDGVWDLYVRVKDGQAERRLRLAGNHSTLERLYFYNQNRDYLVVPYTTNRGNVSFRSREAGVIAKLEDAHMDEEGILLLQGYAFYPGWQIRHPDDLTKSVIFRSEDGSYEKKVEAGQMERREGNEDKERERQEGHGDPARFEIRVNLKDEALLPDHADTLQLHIELAYRGQTLESPPLEYTYKDDGLFLSAVVKTAQGKRKAVLKDRKNREVAFSVSGHTVFSRVKEQWLKLKDSGKMNKVYRYVFKAMEWLPADRNLIVFESFLGKQYSCNPRAIYEYLKEHHPHYKMYWSVDRTHTRPFQERNIP